MATDVEILQLWKGFQKDEGHHGAILRLYRHARGEGRREGSDALEKELLSDSTLAGAINLFGWGGKGKRSVIAMRAVLRAAIEIAKENAEKK